MNKKGILYTVLSAILFGVVPLLSKQLFNYGLDVVGVTFFRNVIPLPILFLIIKSQKQTLSIGEENLKNVAIVGFFGNTLTNLLLNLSYLYLAIGTATTLHFLYPLFVCVMCVIGYHDSLSKKQGIALMLALTGILFFIDLNSLNNIQGILIAATSGVTYAFYMVSVEKKKLNRIHPAVLSFYLSSVVALCMLIINVFTRSIFIPTSFTVWFILLVIAIGCQVFAVSLLQMGIRLLGATTASLFCLFEPLASIVAGYLFLQESLSFAKICGCLIILCAVFLLAKGNKEKYSKKEG